MHIMSQNHTVEYPVTPNEWDLELSFIEKAARNCYQSEPDSLRRAGFIRRLVQREHLAMLEFGRMQVNFVTDRGITHEIVRHRLFSFAQESTRYCKYADEMCFIRPSTWNHWNEVAQQQWITACEQAEKAYNAMLDNRLTLQQARSVLPNSLRASLTVSGNFREWLHFFKLRTANDAHPDMRDLVTPLYEKCKERCPEVFDAC